MPPKRATRERDTAPAATATAAAPAKPRGRPAGVKKEVAEKKKPTAAAPKKLATQTKKPTAEPKANTSKKRKAEADVEERAPPKKLKQTETAKASTKASTKASNNKANIKKAVTKKTSVKKENKVTKVTKTKKPAAAPRAKTPKPAPAPKPKKPKVVINSAPTTQFEVFAFGSNSNAELGMGDTFKKADCPRPKFNSVLSNAGVVQISAGGMHGIALTHDNKVLTWGVNDQGALGRDTTWEGGLKDMDAAEESDSDDEEIEVNPKEATPTEIDLSGVEPGTIFTQVVAADSASFALTDDGLVYGWGTFRVSLA